MCLFIVYVFVGFSYVFFKQKSACEMRIIDWRSDVFSSDLRDAFEALTGLIEAAPLPMWYRGPDLRLAMVNSAYVRAVEGGGAEDVVARGIELVEGIGRASWRASVCPYV